ncbi:hypothetical protein [Candidatus Amarolinea aalborgensis]|uniref:hypothetical protein n=1 Tax=Candidatus Amarolinea aalborgensis TaxID=2249329 RepID=UPI003BF97754
MNKERLFEFLETCDPSTLLNLLSSAYDDMDHDQRRAVFGRLAKAQPPAQVDGEALLAEVEEFQGESLAGAYYAPFAINSKNWTHIPEETKEWFETLGDLLQDSSQLTIQGDHLHAVACFGVLYDLINAMERGEQIVFGDEIGGWMIPGNEQQILAAYMTSLAAVATPAEFAVVALPLIQRDWHSLPD